MGLGGGMVGAWRDLVEGTAVAFWGFAGSISLDRDLSMSFT